jgi:glutaredoxin
VPESRQVVVYSRKGCHLCEVVKESLVKLSRRGGFTWSEVDVDSDSELRRQFNDQVPVVFIDGHKAFKYRMDERELGHYPDGGTRLLHDTSVSSLTRSPPVLSL